MTALAMDVRELDFDETGMVSGGVEASPLPPVDMPDYLRIYWEQIQKEGRGPFNLPPIH